MSELQPNPSEQSLFARAAERIGDFYEEHTRSAKVAAALLGTTAVTAAAPYAGSVATAESGTPIDSSNRAKTGGKLDEDTIRRGTAKAIAQNLLDPFTGAQLGSTSFQYWLEKGMPAQLSANPTHSEVTGDADCNKENTVGINSVYTRPAEQSENPDITSRVEFVTNKCGPYSDSIALLDESGFQSSIDKEVGYKAAAAMKVKTKKVGTVKSIELVTKKHSATINYAKIGDNSLKRIKVTELPNGKIKRTKKLF